MFIVKKFKHTNFLASFLSFLIRLIFIECKSNHFIDDCFLHHKKQTPWVPSLSSTTDPPLARFANSCHFKFPKHSKASSACRFLISEVLRLILFFPPPPFFISHLPLHSCLALELPPHPWCTCLLCIPHLRLLSSLPVRDAPYYQAVQHLAGCLEYSLC